MEKKIIIVGNGGAGMPAGIIQALTAKMPLTVEQPQSPLAFGNMVHEVIETVETALNQSLEMMENLEVEVDQPFLEALEFLNYGELPEEQFKTGMTLLEKGGHGFVALMDAYKIIGEQSEVIMEMGEGEDFVPCSDCIDCGQCSESSPCNPEDCAGCSYQCKLTSFSEEALANMREFLATIPPAAQEHVLDSFDYEGCTGCSKYDECEKIYGALLATAEQITEDDFTEEGEPKITVTSARYPEDFFCKGEQPNAELLEDQAIQVLVNSAAAVKLSPSRQYAVFGRGDTTVIKIYLPDGTERMFVCEDVQMADSDEFSYKIDLPLNEYHTLNGGMTEGEFKVPAPEDLGMERKQECSAKAKEGEDMPEGCIGCPKQDECYQ